MIYRKRGVSVRWENGTRIAVSESGWARESGELFECGPVAELPVPELPAWQHDNRQPGNMPQGITLERFIITRGIAEHEYGDTQWREETERVHVSLTRGALRVQLNSLDEITSVAEALARAQLHEEDAPPRLRLAPNVTAALLPSLVDVAPPNVRIVQSAGAIDGYGQRVEETSINFYRPSYRMRPVRMPFDLRIECEVTEIDRDRPIAIALLGPIERLVLPVLIRDRERVYPALVRVTRIDAVSSERSWYAYGAGSFGAELML